MLFVIEFQEAYFKAFQFQQAQWIIAHKYHDYG